MKKIQVKLREKQSGTLRTYAEHKMPRCGDQFFFGKHPPLNDSGVNFMERKTAGSPLHEGEIAVQKRVGVLEEVT
ncbi:hypothetical protein [Desulfobacter curvatus]|uniref:hypothetical protein n=1 Tax=Desulfobacter curvatus TaxID=2290 RepID=UPI0012F869D5|nr:hypothetical protein [Desulfobacter curvatus]